LDEWDLEKLQYDYGKLMNLVEQQEDVSFKEISTLESKWETFFNNSPQKSASAAWKRIKDIIGEVPKIKPLDAKLVELFKKLHTSGVTPNEVASIVPLWDSIYNNLKFQDITTSE
jgi:hypothetical protein